jgi:general secretion pathway protein D
MKRIKIYSIFALTSLWLAAGIPAHAARVAGEEGVTPTEAPRKVETQKPATVRPSPPPPAKRPPLMNNSGASPGEERNQAQAAPQKSPMNSRFVTIDFDNVDIILFIKFISELTGVNFVVDKGVKGKVTIISPVKISVKEAYKVFESVLEVYGYTTIPSGDVVKIVPAVSARSKDIATRIRREAVSDDDNVVTQLIPLTYASPDDLRKVLAPFISKSSVIVSYPPTGMLIVTDVQSNIKRLLRIIKEIDIPGIGAEISVMPLQSADAEVLSRSLSDLFQRTTAKNKNAAAQVPAIKIVPDKRTNVLIVLASENDTKKVRSLIKLLDRETPKGEGNVRVYYLQHADSEDMVKVLMALPKEAAEGEAKGKAPTISKKIQIVADTATNSLVITAGKEDYQVLEEVIKKLDIPRQMVYLEALLMEVTVDSGFDLGVEWQFAENVGTYDDREFAGVGISKPSGSAITPSIDPTSGAISSAAGLTVGLLGQGITIGGVTFPNVGAVINAYQRDSSVNILSTPQIMTLENEEAQIIVAQNKPFLTSQDVTSTQVSFNNYEYRDIGMTLIITPQINQGQFVRLKISQELSQLLSDEQSTLPTTLKRSTKTTVTVMDGHTMVIGGLINDIKNESIGQTPCLGDIPGLGWLFKSTSQTGNKTNLFIFLTPHIVTNPAEAKMISQEKRDEFDKVEEGVIKLYQERK